MNNFVLMIYAYGALLTWIFCGFMNPVLAVFLSLFCTVASVMISVIVRMWIDGEFN